MSASNGSSFLTISIKEIRTRDDLDGSQAFASRRSQINLSSVRFSSIAASIKGNTIEKLGSILFLTPRSSKLRSRSALSSTHRREAPRDCLVASPDQRGLQPKS